MNALCTAISVLLVSAAAWATPQSVNVDVGANTLFATPSVGYAAAGLAGTWNAFDPGSSGSTGLVGLDGLATSVTLSVSGGPAAAQFDNPATTGDDQALMDDFATLGGGTASFTFAGLINGRYDVYVYAWRPDATSSTTAVLATGGDPCIETSGAAAWSGHSEGATYSLQNVAVSAGVLTIDVTAGFGLGACNGIQLVQKTSSGISTATLGVIKKHCTFAPPGSGFVPVDTESAFGYFWILWVHSSTQEATLVRYHRITCTTAEIYSNIINPGSLSMSSRSVNNLNEFVMSGSTELSVYQFNASNGELHCKHQETVPHKKEIAFVLDVPDCFYSVSAGGQLEKCTLDPVTYALNCTVVTGSLSTDVRGLAFDHVSGVLWLYERSAACPATQGLVRFRALDPLTGADLGVGFTGDLTQPAPNLALGCGLDVDNGALGIVALHQSGASAEMVVYDLGVFASSGVVNYCTSGTSTNGCLATISASAAPSASLATPCVLSVANVEAQRAGVVFYGVSGPHASPWGVGSSSFLCVKAPTQRTGSQSSGGTPNSCDGSYALDWNAYLNTHPSALGSPFGAGDVVHAQAWYRDPPAPKTTNLSNGVELTVQP